MIRTIFAVAITFTALAGCGKANLSDQPHSVEEYAANDQLSADTIEACRARNEAEMRVMQAKPACANVMKAEKIKSDIEMENAIKTSNAQMEEMMAERRREREARKAK